MATNLTEISYNDWFNQSELLNKKVDDADAELKRVISKVANGEKPIGGLYSDAVNFHKDVKKADNAFKKAFKELQNFNKKAPKGYARRQSKEHRARQIAKNKGL